MSAVRLLEPTHIHIYDLRSTEAWQQAREHRALWGRSLTDIAPLDLDHICLIFRPHKDERWRAWENARLRWIFQDLEGRAAS